jgi:hypothetical protein
VAADGPDPAMKEADVWRTANDMIRDYGAEAESCARLRAEKLRDEGIPDGAEEWQRIADAIAELKRHAPDSDESVN